AGLALGVYGIVSLLTLRRFLDTSETSPIEYEAELAGFSELLRQARALVQRVRGRALRPEVPVPPGSEVPGPQESVEPRVTGAVA
ncbi:MAG TPA: hypothetical protein VFE93_13870, partial [Myxococcaceae bacterium]|nr:hypothetical protein [Myxococcaceae bacterium]